MKCLAECQSGCVPGSGSVATRCVAPKIVERLVPHNSVGSVPLARAALARAVDTNCLARGQIISPGREAKQFSGSATAARRLRTMRRMIDSTPIEVGDEKCASASIN
jgi:hypothetical protein